MLLTGGQSFEDLDDLFGLDEGETLRARPRGARGARRRRSGPERRPDRVPLGPGRPHRPRRRRQAPAPGRRRTASWPTRSSPSSPPSFPPPSCQSFPRRRRAAASAGGRAAPARAQPAGEPLPGEGRDRRLQLQADAHVRRPGRRGNPPDRRRPRDCGRLLRRRRAERLDDSADAGTGEAAGDPLDPSTPIPDGEEVSRIAL